MDLPLHTRSQQGKGSGTFKGGSPGGGEREGDLSDFEDYCRGTSDQPTLTVFQGVSIRWKARKEVGITGQNLLNMVGVMPNLGHRFRQGGLRRSRARKSHNEGTASVQILQGSGSESKVLKKSGKKP